MKSQPFYHQTLSTIRNALYHPIHNEAEVTAKPNEEEEVLAQTITRFKTKRIMKIFVGKLKRNMLSGKP